MSSIKRDVKKKVLPRPESRCCLEIQPTVSCTPRFSREGLLWLICPFSEFIFSGSDDADRVLKLGKRNRFLSVNHGSIGGSWPIAISGYPRGHSV